MSLSNFPPRKANPELSRLIDQYLANGGQITKKPSEGNVATICSACHHKRYVSIAYAQSFGRRCIKCGSTTTIQWT